MDGSQHGHDSRFGEVARSIRELDRVAGLELAFEVGELLFEGLYRGDPERLRRHGPDDLELRQLAAQPELELGPRGLDRVLALYDVIAQLGGVGACRHIGVDHVRAVLGLTDRGRLELLRLAEQYRWSVGELEQAARRLSDGWHRPAAPAPASARAAAASAA